MTPSLKAKMLLTVIICWTLMFLPVLLLPLGVFTAPASAIALFLAGGVGGAALAIGNDAGRRAEVLTRSAEDAGGK
jgi:hypothetical protein